MPSAAGRRLTVGLVCSGHSRTDRMVLRPFPHGQDGPLPLPARTGWSSRPFPRRYQPLQFLVAVANRRTILSVWEGPEGPPPCSRSLSGFLLSFPCRIFPLVSRRELQYCLPLSARGVICFPGVGGGGAPNSIDGWFENVSSAIWSS